MRWVLHKPVQTSRSGTQTCLTVQSVTTASGVLPQLPRCSCPHSADPHDEAGTPRARAFLEGDPSRQVTGTGAGTLMDGGTGARGGPIWRLPSCPEATLVHASLRHGPRSHNHGVEASSVLIHKMDSLTRPCGTAVLAPTHAVCHMAETTAPTDTWSTRSAGGMPVHSPALREAVRGPHPRHGRRGHRSCPTRHGSPQSELHLHRTPPKPVVSINE